MSLSGRAAVNQYSGDVIATSAAQRPASARRPSLVERAEQRDERQHPERAGDNADQRERGGSDRTTSA